MCESDLELIIRSHFSKGRLVTGLPNANVILAGLAERLSLGMTRLCNSVTIISKKLMPGSPFSKWKRHDLISWSSWINAVFSLALRPSVRHTQDDCSGEHQPTEGKDGGNRGVHLGGGSALAQTHSPGSVCFRQQGVACLHIWSHSHSQS